jgi:hypothetical protein
MRLPALALLFLGASTAASAANGPILVLMQFENSHSEAAVTAMKREFASIMQGAGLQFDYKLRSELSEFDTPGDIILVKFKGQCRMKLLPELFDERGPFATTEMVDGNVQPFSQIACDRVRVSVRSSMSGRQKQDGDTVLGRALGRVLAHEVYHILSKSPHHGSKGVARTSLSSVHLTAEKLEFDLSDIGKMIALP